MSSEAQGELNGSRASDIKYIRRLIMSGISIIPQFCIKARNFQLSGIKLSSLLSGIRQDIRKRRDSFLSMYDEMAGRYLTRRWFNSMKTLRAMGTAEIKNLELCMRCLESWSKNKNCAYLDQAMEAYNNADILWHRRLRFLTELSGTDTIC